MTDWLEIPATLWQQLAQLLAADLSLLLAPDMLVRLLLLVALFTASAFFSGSETALFSLSRLELRRLRRRHDPQAETLHALLDQPRRLIISILCGNELVNVAAAANLTGILVHLYGIERAAWLSSFLMVPLLLLFGEATPKTIAVSNPVGVSTRIVAWPMSAWVTLITPLSSLIRRFAHRITTAIVGEEKAPENILQVDEFRTLVDEGVVRGELSATERALIYNLLQAGSTEIAEIMTPRTRMAFVDGDLPVPQLIGDFIRQRRNRIPVYRDQRDRIIGFLHAEDIMRLILDGTDLSTVRLADILHPPVMVPSTKKIDEMFDYFQDHDVQAAAVLNEFGGVDGFLTMHDVLTSIFGRPAGELAEPEVVHDRERDAYEVPGEMKLHDFNQLTRYQLDDERMTTVGGAVLRRLDRLPAVGDTVSIDDVQLTVTEMDSNRIARVRARRRPVNGSGTDPEAVAGAGPPRSGG